MYIQHRLGLKFLAPPQLDLAKVLEDSTSVNPVVFILAPGSDPVESIRSLAARVGLPSEKLHLISLGQGQQAKAESTLEHARWVLLRL